MVLNASVPELRGLSATKLELVSEQLLSAVEPMMEQILMRYGDPDASYTGFSGPTYGIGSG
jgi:hypothetical protein